MNPRDFPKCWSASSSPTWTTPKFFSKKILISRPKFTFRDWLYIKLFNYQKYVIIKNHWGERDSSLRRADLLPCMRRPRDHWWEWTFNWLHLGVNGKKSRASMTSLWGGQRLLESGKNIPFTPRTNDLKAQISGAGPTDIWPTYLIIIFRLLA